ncbi:MAG: ATP-binding cassette domain-containing protein [Gammaproteobacteria bacterium]
MSLLSEEDQDAGLAMRISGLGVRLPRGRGLRRFWGESHWALQGVEFTLERGETLAVMGRNGSGKSTLLRTLARIIEPDVGSIEQAPGLTSAILAPGAGFDGSLTGRENVFNAALYHGYLPNEVAPRLDDIIGFSELGAWIDEPVGIYSAGMRARLGFSLSLFLPPDILMIDETLSAGDGNFRDKAREAVQDLISSSRTVILVSHNRETVRGMCRRALVLNRGVQVAEGDVEAMIHTYEAVLQSQQGERQTVVPVGADPAADQNLNALQKERGAFQARRLEAGARVEAARKRYYPLVQTLVDEQSELIGKLRTAAGVVDDSLLSGLDGMQGEERSARAELDQALAEYHRLLERERALIAEIKALQKRRTESGA